MHQPRLYGLEEPVLRSLWKAATVDDDISFISKKQQMTNTNVEKKKKKKENQSFSVLSPQT